MCGRYWVDESPEMREIMEQMNRSPLIEKFQKNTTIATKGEIRPTQVVPVIASNRGGSQTVFPMKWGFSSRSLLINARVETAASKPTFKEAWQSHRCIIPASYYFEWEHYAVDDGKKRTGDKYMIQPRGTTVTWLCGLYRMEDGLPSFVILTREPAEEIRFIHDRMPLIMPQEYVREWIRPTVTPEELINASLSDMVFEKVG